MINGSKYYKEILTDEFIKDEDTDIEFSKINIVIGKNNSGKSRFVRNILNMEYKALYNHNLKKEKYKTLTNHIDEILKKFDATVAEDYKKTYFAKVSDDDYLIRSKYEEAEFASLIASVCGSSYLHNITSILTSKKFIDSKVTVSVTTYSSFTSLIYTEQEFLYQAYADFINEGQSVEMKSLYFPSIINLRPLNQNLNKCENIGCSIAKYNVSLSSLIKDEYFKDTDISLEEIKTGQEMYEDLKNQLLGLSKDRINFTDFEKFIGENFFGEKDISIFIRDSDGLIYFKHGEELERPIHEHGDGMQTLLIIMYYLYKNQNSFMKVFIEEPEIHLHPGLQRVLVEALLNFSKFQYFITTHSSSFIDVCDEYDDLVSIITIENTDDKKRVSNSVYDDMNLYDLIGIRPSSLILSNSVIWVEGPTDLYYIDTLLSLHRKINENKNVIKLGYNYNYAFNGSINVASKFDFDNDDELSVKFKKLSLNNFIIFDSDSLDKNNSNYFKSQVILEKMGEESSHIMENVNTIENIIHPKILIEFLDENYKPGTKYKSFKSLFLKFFESKLGVYQSKGYKKMDLLDALQEFVINNQKTKISEKEIKKYIKNYWLSEKVNIANYYKNYIDNLNDQEQLEFYNNIISDVKIMIEKISIFIDKNN